MNILLRKISIGLLALVITCSIVAQNTAWQIVVTDRGSDYISPSLANGMIGILPSKNNLSIDKIILNGVYDKESANYANYPGKYEIMQKGIDFASMDIETDGILASDTKNQKNWKQQLNLKDATLTTYFELAGKLEVEHKLITLRHLASSGMVSVKLKAKENLKVKVYDYLNFPDSHVKREVVYDIYQISQADAHYLNIFRASSRSKEGNQQFGAANTYLFHRHNEPEFVLNEKKDGTKSISFEVELKKGESYSFCIIGSACASEHFSDPVSEAERLSIFAKLEGKDKLLKDHKNAWAKLWESDIIIEGNLQVQQDVRFALFNLYMSSREGLALAIPPLGLSDIGWRGHIFWDYELWMYPAMLLLQPNIAKEGLNYRYNRLQKAMQNASSQGYKGAKYPWQSAKSGGEETPPMFLTGPFQHHITGDVAWAFWQYYLVTKDLDWLKEKAYPVIKECADFWLSRVSENEKGEYEILNVVCADEYAENVDNNAFTNGVAIMNLNIATKAAKLVGEKSDPNWTKLADNIVIHRFEDGTIQEYKGYKGDTIKQADVNLLSFPLNYITDKETIKKNVAYYSAVLSSRGPAMSQSVYSVLSTRTGDCNKAKQYFDEAYLPNKVGPFGVISEAKVNVKPYFLTGAGGMLQAIMFGFAGLQITEEGLVKTNQTCLPEGWKSITIKGVGPENKSFVLK
jgi:trehalose/maltose hydrolase-like predicted phosphorylase